MNATELLALLQQKGARVWLDDDRLRLRAAKGAITPALQRQVAAHRPELIALLSAPDLAGELSADPEHRHEPFELTDVQSAYWLGRRADFELGNVGAHVYLELAGEGLDPARLSETWQMMIARHDMLRAVIHADGSQQVLADVPPYQIRIVDSAGWPEEEREAALLRERERMIHQVLAPDCWPLFEILFVDLGGNRHRLLLKYDALILDAQSQEVLLSEWGTLYHHPEEALPQLAITFRDYMVGRQNFRESAGYKQAEAYWLKRVPTLPLAPELPLAVQPASITEPRCCHLIETLDAASWQTLKDRARTFNVTASGLLLVVFAEVLKLWSRTQRFCLNLTLFNRAPVHPQINRIVGDFTSLTVLEVESEPGISFTARAKAAQTQLWQDMEQSAFTGVDLQRALSQHHHRQISLPVVFTSTIYQRNDGDTAGRRWLGEDVEIAYPTPQVSLDYVVAEERGELQVIWNYIDGLYPEQMLSLMLDSYGAYLRLLANREEVWNWNAVQFQRQLIPAAWFDTLRAYNQTEQRFDLADMMLHQLFERQAQLNPNQVAVRTDELQLSYAELDDLTNQLAAKLRELRVEPETLVAVAMYKGWEQVVAVLGILKAGAAYLPIDASVPQQRMTQLLVQGEVRVVLTQSCVNASFHWLDDTCAIYVDDLETGAAPSPGLEPVQTADDLAYVIFTSGSTGTPKGVEIQHRAAVNTILDINQRFGVGSGDRVLALSSLAFDLSVYDVFGALAAGATIVMPSASDAKEPSAWAELVRREGITVWNSVPQLMQLLVDHCASGGLEVFDRLRLVMLSGDWIPVSLPVRIRSQTTAAEIISLGGATEGSIWSIYYPIAEVPASWESIPYGYPLANQQFHVLTETLDPCQPWMAGDLYIGGAGISRGYWKDEALTRESFPVNPHTGERLYRTGDRGRFHPSGIIEFLGREDDQVKLRGFRVELGEVEATLVRHEGVEQSAVVIQTQSGQEQHLIAYVVFTQDEVPAQELRAFLVGRLPDYMVPETFVPILTIPLTSNGKVDRSALPRLDLGKRQATTELAEPQTSLQALLKTLWEETLGVDGIGVNDNFFELGGNSIHVAAITNRIREQLGGVLHLGAVFNNPTVTQLEAFIQHEYPELAGSCEDATNGDATVTPDQVRWLRSQIWEPPPLPERSARNPPAVFILAPPRSGSTLLRVMLQGHSKLFAPPELFLLSYDTLREQATAFSGYRRSALESNLRAIMALNGCEAHEASEIRRGFEQEDLSVADFYAWIQERLGDAMLVDKTPSYPLSVANLERAEAIFDGALYIHLTRHPYGMIHSFEEARMEQEWFPYMTGNRLTPKDCPFDRRALAEMVWRIEHENIRQFLDGVPDQRQLQISFEQLVSCPDVALSRICEFLGLEMEEPLLRPYEDGAHRMTDGIHQVSRMQGDLKFHDHRQIDPAVATRWRNAIDRDFLSPMTWELADTLGYTERAETTLKRIPREAGIPLSFTQERVWFMEQFRPDSRVGNSPLALRVEGDLSVDAFFQVYSELIRRHEVFRLRCRDVDGVPVLSVAADSQDFDATRLLVDLCELPEEAREAEASQMVHEDALRPFDLSTGPLLRCRVFRLAEQTHIVLLTTHHFAVDGRSMGLLADEISALYAAFSAGKPSPLRDLDLQYVDISAWQREQMQGPAQQAQLAYWKKQLADLPVLDLPTDRQRSSLQTDRGASLRISLPPPLASRLKVLSQDENVTLFMLLLAAFQTLLQRYSGQDDIVVATAVSNRNHSHAEGVIGSLANTPILRTDLSGEPTFKELLQRVRSICVDAFAHQDIPFEVLVDQLQRGRDLSRNPLFQVLFSLHQRRAAQEVKIPGARVSEYPVDTATTQYDLGVNFFDTEQELFGNLAYNTDLFERETIECFSGHFVSLLEGIAADANRAIGDLPLLTPQQRRQQISAWSTASAGCSGQLFEHHAIDRQLNERANQLAWHLLNLGVQPEARIGFALDQPQDVAIALLGIWKARAACVPLQASDPAPRLAFMIEDAGIGIVVTRVKPGSRFGGLVECIVCLEETVGASMANPPLEYAQTDLAAVLYTSESAGPAGLLIEHAAVVWDSQSGARPTLDWLLQEPRYVLDERARLLPTGARGELYLGGIRGYLNRSRLTAERFVPNPFSEKPGPLLFRTGQGGRWRADGRLESLGRLDDKILLDGQVIAPGEIESLLGEHPLVEQSVVICRDQRLIAYFVGSAGAAELDEHLRAHLPAYMVPATFIDLTSMPLRRDGTVDCVQLPDLQQTQPAPPVPTVFCPIQEQLAAIWRDTLSLETVGLQDSFFDLGGDSLTAMRIAARINQDMGKSVSLLTIFQHDTIADLALAMGG